jgi:dUTP pyrophosphatase
MEAYKNMKIINISKNEVKYQTPYSAGFDIPCSHNFTIAPSQVVLVCTGLFLGVDEFTKQYKCLKMQLNDLEYELQVIENLEIRPRSSLAYKYGITVLNSPGTIDEDYLPVMGSPNEIKVLLINHGSTTVEFKAGDRIAQGVVTLAIPANNIEVKKEDRSGGFGSTGV